MVKWLSRDGIYVDVWDTDTMTLTTFRFGKKAYLEFSKTGLVNQISSLAGSRRIFASSIDFNTSEIINSWVHECDPWTYHRDFRTLAKLSERVSEVYDDIIDGEAMSEVKARKLTLSNMKRHYAELDSLFYGNMDSDNPVQNDERSDDDSQTR